ncbi:hypothetical protein bcgnr5410_56900 [Bacillus cereus]
MFLDGIKNIYIFPYKKISYCNKNGHFCYKDRFINNFIKLEDFSDYEAISNIIKITGGNFRLIQRLFTQIERILEINKLNTITTDVVEAARDSLVIGIK